MVTGLKRDFDYLAGKKLDSFAVQTLQGQEAQHVSRVNEILSLRRL